MRQNMRGSSQLQIFRNVLNCITVVEEFTEIIDEGSEFIHQTSSDHRIIRRGAINIIVSCCGHRELLNNYARITHTFATLSSIVKGRSPDLRAIKRERYHHRNEYQAFTPRRIYNVTLRRACN